jgi:hypothetical protein
MCVARHIWVGLQWGGSLRIEVQPLPPPPQFVVLFLQFFHFVSLCPNTEQSRLPIGHLQNENDCHVSYISIYLIAIQYLIRDNVLPTHLSYAIPLDHHLILSA